MIHSQCRRSFRTVLGRCSAYRVGNMGNIINPISGGLIGGTFSFISASEVMGNFSFIPGMS